MGLLDTSSGWGTLTSSLGGKLFAWSFPSSGFAGSLFGTSHFGFERKREKEKSSMMLFVCSSTRLFVLFVSSLLSRNAHKGAGLYGIYLYVASQLLNISSTFTRFVNT
jgi:hypothetical protein